MQVRNEQREQEIILWKDVQENYVKALERIRELEKENEHLLERLRLSEAYRFCDKERIIVN